MSLCPRNRTSREGQHTPDRSQSVQIPRSETGPAWSRARPNPPTQEADRRDPATGWPLSPARLPGPGEVGDGGSTLDSGRGGECVKTLQRWESGPWTVGAGGVQGLGQRFSALVEDGAARWPWGQAWEGAASQLCTLECVGGRRVLPSAPPHEHTQSWLWGLGPLPGLPLAPMAAAPWSGAESNGPAEALGVPCHPDRSAHWAAASAVRAWRVRAGGFQGVPQDPRVWHCCGCRCPLWLP